MKFCDDIRAQEDAIRAEDGDVQIVGHAPFLRDFRAVAAIDLSTTTDLTAAAIACGWPDHVMIDATIWTPADTAETRAREDQAPYHEWIRDGYVVGVPGEIMDYAYVARWMQFAHRHYGVEDFAYDAWRIATLKRDLEREGVEAHDVSKDPELADAPGIRLVPHPQGFAQRGKTGLNMPDSIDATERLLIERKLHVPANPALRSAAMGMVLGQDQSLNRRPLKVRSTTRIDAAVALVMAVGMFTLGEQTDGVREAWESGKAQAFMEAMNKG